MTTVAYTNYTNIDAGFFRPYEPGDRLVRGWTGTVEVARGHRITGDGSLMAAAEVLFARHNRDDRPDGQMCPSMSIGDVILFGEVGLSVDHIGFVVVRVDPTDLITDRTWVEIRELL